MIQHILNEEFERLEKLALKYEELTSNLPKGSISKKIRGNNTYLYRAYREKDKINLIILARNPHQMHEKPNGSMPSVRITRANFAK